VYTDIIKGAVPASFPDSFLIIFMILCIKIAPYELRPDHQDIFEYLREVGLQTIDPSSLAARSIQATSKIIYCSPLRRAIESVSVNSSQKLVTSELLKEIPFDLGKLCSREEHSIYKSIIVRKRFKESFIHDTLPISHQTIFLELKMLLNQARAEDQDVTIISHSFRLKILEAYIKSGGRLEHEPGLIEQYLFDDQKTFDFREGFNISPAQLSAIDFFAKI
jgi:hypothetical protein